MGRQSDESVEVVARCNGALCHAGGQRGKFVTVGHARKIVCLYRDIAGSDDVFCLDKGDGVVGRSILTNDDIGTCVAVRDLCRCGNALVGILNGIFGESADVVACADRVIRILGIQFCLLVTVRGFLCVDGEGSGLGQNQIDLLCHTKRFPIVGMGVFDGNLVRTCSIGRIGRGAVFYLQLRLL